MDPPLAPRLARLTDSKVQILARLEDRQPTRLVSAQSIWAETGNLVRGIYIQGLTNSLEIEIGSRSVLFTQASVSELVMIWLLIRNSSPFSPIFQTILSIKKKKKSPVLRTIGQLSTLSALMKGTTYHFFPVYRTQKKKKEQNKKNNFVHCQNENIYVYLFE